MSRKVSKQAATQPRGHRGADAPRSPGIVLAIGCSVLLAWLFWWPLWQGGGLIGGDLYPYYFPQKVFYAESLKQGFVPLWNPYVGFGYPVLGESQTGAFSPPNLLLYFWLKPNTAYNVSQLLHYIVAFIASWGVARRLGVSSAGACLAATVFVYGWFPARICLEWAIIGGAWFALILWSATAYLQDRSSRPLILLSLFLGLDLLAGHYNLAFITLLTLVGLWFLVPPGENGQKGRGEEGTKGRGDAAAVSVSSSPLFPVPVSPLRGFRDHSPIPLAAALACGFLIAAPQLVSSWELKSLSQRREINAAFAPTYGHLPPVAISQLWMPWSWYAGEQPTDRYLEQSRFLCVPDATNQVEAQLYLGLIPLLLVVLGLACGPLRRELPLARPWGWLILALLSLFFATGWPTYWFSDLPGIGFFRGPGRYSMVAAFSLALLAGGGMDALFRHWEQCVPGERGASAPRSRHRGTDIPRSPVVLCLMILTIIDLWAASRKYQFGMPPFFGRQVFYATMVGHPPIDHVEESPLRRYFAERPEARLYAPGPNVPSLLNVSALPTYLGLGPAIYETEAVRVDFTLRDPEQVDESSGRLRNFGVTHLLLEERIDPMLWPVEPLGEVMDPYLNRAFARSEPYYFYKLQESRGRVYFANGSTPREDGSAPTGLPRILSFDSTPHRVRVEIEASPGDELVLADLWYPGWRLRSGEVESRPYEEHFRSAVIPNGWPPDRRGTVEWSYHPPSLYWGLALSLLGLAGIPLLPRLCSPSRRP